MGSFWGSIIGHKKYDEGRGKPDNEENGSLELFMCPMANKF